MTNVYTANNKCSEAKGYGHTKYFLKVKGLTCMKGVHLKRKLRYTEKVKVAS